MAYKKIDGYRRTPQPIMPSSRERWLEEELRKLEQTVERLIAAIEELRAKVP